MTYTDLLHIDDRGSKVSLEAKLCCVGCTCAILIFAYTKWAANFIVFSIIMAGSAFAQNTPKFTDPEIASMAVVANQTDLGYADIAKVKSKNAEVLKFADTMATDHKAVIDQAVALVTKLKVTPKDNAVSKSLVANGEKENAQFKIWECN